MILEVIAAAALAGAVSGALGFFAGNHRPPERLDEEVPETEAGAVEVRWGYTAHPEAFFDLLERDIAVLDPNDRVRLNLRLQVIQGWNKKEGKSGWSGNLGPIEAPADQVVEIAKALLMDDNSPLVHKSQDNDRQRRFLIRKWGKRSGLDSLTWADSDSPLHITVSGSVRAPPRREKAPEDDPQMQAAKAEVERLTGAHRAVLHAKHTEVG